MPAQAFNLIPSRSSKTNKIRKNEFKLLIPDLKFLGETVQRVAATEIQKQIKFGNNPVNLIVDNRKSRSIDQATFRVYALFSDPKQIAIATNTVLRFAIDYTRKESGTAKASFEIWVVNDRDDPGTFKMKAGSANLTTLTALAEKLPPTGRLVVVGPMVEYGRKLYWNPAFARKSKGTRARYSAGYDTATGKLSRIRTGNRDTNMRDLIVGRTRSKYKALSIIGRWVLVDMAIGGDPKWPGIAIGFKGKGSLL